MEHYAIHWCDLKVNMTSAAFTGMNITDSVIMLLNAWNIPTAYWCLTKKTFICYIFHAIQDLSDLSTRNWWSSVNHSAAQVSDWSPLMSDHCATSVYLNIPIIRNTPHVNQTNKWKAPKKLKWDKNKEFLFSQKLQSTSSLKKINDILHSNVDHRSDIEETVKCISDILCDAANVCMKKCTASRTKKIPKRCKWLDHDLNKLRIEIKKMGKQITNDHQNTFLRHKFFAMKKSYKKLVIKKKNSMKQAILNDLELLESNNPKEYWALFDQLKSDNASHESNNAISEEEWINHYSSLLGRKQFSNDHSHFVNEKIKQIMNEPVFSELDFTITPEEIEQSIKTLKKNKAVGIDCISGEMIQCSSSHMMNGYVKLFNAILNTSHYPSAWKQGIIVNLFKSGQQHDPDNYRGLSINSCLAKVFNTIMNNRLNNFLIEKNIIDKSQIGFKKKARTSDHIFVMNTILQKYSRCKQKLYLCFVDFKKAFDSVWHDALMLKLLENGVCGNFFKVIKNMYEDVYSCIRMNDVLSDMFKCQSGVRQGDVLSPSLFNIFVNDLPKSLYTSECTPKLGSNYVNCLMYADDLVIMSLSTDELQLQLNSLDAYCKRWGLEINKKKTKTMVMAKYGQKCPSYNLKIGDHEIEWVTTYKYLGMELNNNGNLTQSAKNLCARSWKAIFKMNSTLKNINVKTKTRLHLFDHLVRPIACYGSEVWGSSMYLPANKLSLSSFWEKAEKLPTEQLHLRYLKISLGVHSKATNSAVKGEVGRFPLILHIAKSMLKYWSHMTDPNYVNPLLKEACDEALLLENTPGTWAYSCKQLCDLFQYKWTGNAPNDREINAIITNMKKSYIEFWKGNIGDPTNVHGKLSTYRKLKTSFTFENYLDTVTVKKYRASMTAFRISAHKLEIERLRYTKSKIPRNERLCTLCTNNNLIYIGDEFHAAMICHTFAGQRRALFELFAKQCKNFIYLEPWDKFLYMLNSEGPLATATSKFLYEVMSVPRNLPV